LLSHQRQKKMISALSAVVNANKIRAGEGKKVCKKIGPDSDKGEKLKREGTVAIGGLPDSDRGVSKENLENYYGEGKPLKRTQGTIITVVGGGAQTGCATVKKKWGGSFAHLAPGGEMKKRGVTTSLRYSNKENQGRQIYWKVKKRKW